jgi:hypothetical protein
VIRRRRASAAVVILALAVAAIAIASSGNTSHPIIGPPLPGLGQRAPSGDPFAYVPSRESAFVQRAEIGNAQVLFTKSPGGVLATAARVADYRPAIDRLTRGTGIDPNMLEGLVFLESGGEPNVIAGTDPVNASGLTQILASTGQSLLGMHIDLSASRRLTGEINAAGTGAQVQRLEHRREAVDDRFNPAKELAATVRYLEIARHDFGGREDLAFESYHMGIGNLQQVLADYDGGTPVSYARLYFDSSPAHNRTTYDLLSSFSDDSNTYLWRLEAAVLIMRLYRTGRAALVRLNRLETSFPSNALVLVPDSRYKPFAGPAALSAAYQHRTLLPLPRNAAALGLAYSATMGSNARLLKVPAGLYRGLRPAALDMLIELAARVRALAHTKAPLIVASTVTDGRYANLLGVDDPPASTGFTFQIERRYVSATQAEAFQSMLDRLQSLNLIAWIRGTDTIEITVAPDADAVIAHGV